VVVAAVAETELPAAEWAERLRRAVGDIYGVRATELAAHVSRDDVRAWYNDPDRPATPINRVAARVFQKVLTGQWRPLNWRSPYFPDRIG
jgi:hypothetical protein